MPNRCELTRCVDRLLRADSCSNSREQTNLADSWCSIKTVADPNSNATIRHGHIKTGMRAAIQSMRTNYLSNDYSLHELCKGWLGVQWCKLRMFFEARKVLKSDSNRLFTQRDSSVNVFGFALGQFLAGDRSMIAAGKTDTKRSRAFRVFREVHLAQKACKGNP